MRQRLALPLLALTSLSTCVCDAPAPLPTAHLDLDTILGAGEVRCGPVIRDSELIGGPQAFGQANRAFRCHNSRIRFVVQDASRPAGNSVEGGNLVDIDRGRGDEVVDGEDTFREHVSGFGAQELAVTSIDIENDGTNGQTGVIRVTGTPTALSLAPQANFLSQNLQGTLITEYRLDPDSDIIEIKTIFRNESDNNIFGALGADFLAVGAATPIMTPQSGFGDVEPFSKVDFIAGARGPGVNVAFVCDGKQLTVPLVDAGVTVPICEDSLDVGDEISFSRFIVVGDGSLDSVTRVAWERLGTATGEVTGTVENAVAGTVVSALSAPSAEENSHLVSEASVGDDGAYSLRLPAGDYSLVAHVPNIQGQVVGRSAEVAVTVVADQVVDAALSLGRSGRVSVSTDFGDGASHAAKLTLVALDDTQRGVAALRDFARGGSTIRYDVSADGTFDVEVPPGRYRAFVTRGFEWSRFEREIDVAAGATVTVAASIAHVVDTAGFLGGEFHQHSLGSIDAEVPTPIKVMENAAEGIEIAVSTEHDNIVDYRPIASALGLDGQMVAFPGNEVSYQGIGHFNAYPWDMDPADPRRDSGSSMWWEKTVPEMYDDIRAGGGDDIIIQLNHPRSGLTGVLASMVFDPTTGARFPRDPPNLKTLPPTVYADWSPAFDAIEVNTNLGDVNLYTEASRQTLQDMAEDDATDVPVLADWFGLMNAGLPIAAMGNSDTHNMNGPVGFPRTFLAIDKAPADVVEADVTGAIRAQRTAIGEGCLITVLADGALHAGKGDVVDSDAALTITLQAPPHVTVGRLELYVGGLARGLVAGDAATSVDVDDVAGVLSLPLADVVGDGDVVRLDHAIAGLDIADDSIVVAVSRGGSGLAPTGGGEVICVSPPVYVDGDGDGAFTPPFAATEQVTTRTGQ